MSRSLTTLLVVLLPTVTFAQPPAAKPAVQPRAIQPRAVQAQPLPARVQPRAIQLQGQAIVPAGRGGASSIFLVRNPQVEEELKLTDEQKTKIGGAFEEMQTASRGVYQGIAQVPQNERQKKLEEARKKVADARDKAEKTIGDVLDKTQKTRLAQIRIQIAGPRALQLEKVQGDLKLTDEQKASVEKAIASERTKRQEVLQNVRNGNIQRTDLAKKLEEVRASVETEATAALTDEQRTAFEKMKGEKFELKQRGAAAFRLQPGVAPRIRVRPAQPKDDNRT